MNEGARLRSALNRRRREADREGEQHKATERIDRRV